MVLHLYDNSDLIKGTQKEKTSGEAMRQQSRGGGVVSTKQGTPGSTQSQERGWMDSPLERPEERPCPPLEFGLLASTMGENTFLMFKKE